MNTPEFDYVEKPALELLQKLGYEYLEASQVEAERDSVNDVVLKNRLDAAIRRINPWMNDNNVNRAMRKITAVPGASLMEINKKIHNCLRESVVSFKQTIDGRFQDKSIYYIDYNHIENNNFLVVNQVQFLGRQGYSVPDLVVYINGLPIAVLECKSPKVQDAASEAINDLHYYQGNSERLFYYNQICAALYKVGGKYGAINADELYYHVYKSDDREPVARLIDRAVTSQDIMIYHLFKKERLLDLIRNFVIFEVTEKGETVKKLPRYQQVRAVNKAVAILREQGKGGVVWHTQGSGKSISMVYLATKLRRDELGFDNPTIIVMTDRVDLDNQISGTFESCGFPNPIQAKSIRNLQSLLKDHYGKTIMTTIQKFQETDEEGRLIKSEGRKDKQGNITTVKRVIDDSGQLVKITTVKNKEGNKIKEDREIIEVPELSPKSNIFVFADEAHRSHYGFLAGFMRKALPNAKFIAFTGTPLSKENKSTLAEFYGGKYLDVYTIKQSVEDEATLKIYYEARMPELHVKKELIDEQFELEFGHHNPAKKERLLQRAASLTTYLTARKRIYRIAEDIIHHYKTKVYPDGFKAMVVCHNREAAAAYADAFDRLALEKVHNFKTQLIMSLNIKKDSDIFKQLTVPPKDLKKRIKNFKLPFGNEQERSLESKKKYDNTAITIVCDMLLTGYDVPIAQVMYLDKVLTEHNLLQAIARVNRKYESKTGGFVVDYCGITGHLSRALHMFSEDLSPGDVMEKPIEELHRLEQLHRRLVGFFNPVRLDRHSQREEYIDRAVQYLEPADLRDEFKVLLRQFNQSLSVLLPAPEALAFEYDFKLYNEIKYQAANLYVDDPLRVTKAETKKLQKLVDEHLHSSGIEYLLEAPISIIDREKFDQEIEKALSIKSKELKIINRLRHIIKINLEKNPEFYRPLSQRLEELVKMRREDRIEQVKLFQECESIREAIVNQQAERQRLGFSYEREFAVYKTLETRLSSSKNARQLTQALFQDLSDELGIAGWKEMSQVQKTMRRKIKGNLASKVPGHQRQQLALDLLEVIKQNT